MIMGISSTAHASSSLTQAGISLTQPGTSLTQPGTSLTQPGTSLTQPGTSLTQPGTSVSMIQGAKTIETKDENTDSYHNMDVLSVATKSNHEVTETSSQSSHDRPDISTKIDHKRVQILSQPRQPNMPADVVQHKRYIKPTIIYVTLVMALMICTVPYSLYSVILKLLRIHPQKLAIQITIILVQFNSCLNPIMYALTNKKLRQFYTQKLVRLFRRGANM